MNIHLINKKAYEYTRMAKNSPSQTLNLILFEYNLLKTTVSSHFRKTLSFLKTETMYLFVYHIQCNEVIRRWTDTLLVLVFSWYLLIIRTLLNETSLIL